jgi:hypothetical protein
MKTIEKINNIIDKSELKNMVDKHFDSETGIQMIQELKDNIEKILPEEVEINEEIDIEELLDWKSFYGIPTEEKILFLIEKDNKKAIISGTYKKAENNTYVFITDLPFSDKWKFKKWAYIKK